METTQKKSTSFKGIKSAGWVIVCCFVIAICIYHFLLGNPSNFMNNDPTIIRFPVTFWGQSTKVELLYRLFRLYC